MKFRAELLKTGANTAGIEVPQSVLDALGGGKRARVKVALNGFAFSLTLGSMGGKVMIPISAERRLQGNLERGQTYEIEIDLDTAPQRIDLPDDAMSALADAGLWQTFAKLAPSHQKEHAHAIAEAKKPETRKRRIAAMLEKLKS